MCVKSSLKGVFTNNEMGNRITPNLESNVFNLFSFYVSVMKKLKRTCVTQRRVHDLIYCIYSLNILHYYLLTLIIYFN